MTRPSTARGDTRPGGGSVRLPGNGRRPERRPAVNTRTIAIAALVIAVVLLLIFLL
jgi:hypothetical protein